MLENGGKMRMANTQVKIISQVDEQHSNCVRFYLILNADVRQIACAEFIPGTSFADGIKASEDIVKALQSVYTKRIKELKNE